MPPQTRLTSLAVSDIVVPLRHPWSWPISLTKPSPSRSFHPGEPWSSWSVHGPVMGLRVPLSPNLRIPPHKSTLVFFPYDTWSIESEQSN